MSNNNKVRITVDVLGADNAPDVVLNGIDLALKKDKDLEILACGPKSIIDKFCLNRDRCKALYAEEKIEMHEHPAMSIKKKKDSTIVVGCRSVKDNLSDGFYSAGNTGACLSGALLIIGRIKGIKRPMLAALLPALNNKKTLFCDVGANADCKPEYLMQFGVMANSYIQQVLNIDNPKIALLNIGEEDTKGNILVKESFSLLKSSLKNFKGNAEGRDLLSGKFDAIITDGFTGNVVLKNTEATFKFTFKLLKSVFLSNLKSKIAALMIKGKIKSLVSDLDPESVGAAYLLGIRGACCIGHGNSSSKAICNGILNTASYARGNVYKVIENIII